MAKGLGVALGGVVYRNICCSQVLMPSHYLFHFTHPVFCITSLRAMCRLMIKGQPSVFMSLQFNSLFFWQTYEHALLKCNAVILRGCDEAKLANFSFYKLVFREKDVPQPHKSAAQRCNYRGKYSFYIWDL